MSKCLTLDNLPVGKSARVARLCNEGEERRRLLDLGLCPGTLIAVEMRSPLGDPTSYRIRGSSIALRRSQASLVELETCDPPEEGGQP